MHDSIHDERDLREFLRPIWARKWLILAIVVAATVLTYVYAERKPDEYTASTRIFLEGSQLDALLYGTAPGEQSDRSVVNQATLLETRGVAKEVAERLNFRGEPAQLLSSVTIAPEEGSDFILITATAGSARGAAGLANAFADAFIELRAAEDRDKLAAAVESAKEELDALPEGVENESARDDLERKISRLEAAQALPSGTATQVDEAVPPDQRTSPKPRQAALFAFAISFVFSILAAFGLERFDRRVRDVHQLPDAYHAPLLAALPQISRSKLDSGGLTIPEEFREVVRGLRTNLQLAQIDEPVRTLLVTSAIAGEGKSTLVRHLALAHEEAGMRVAIIECDLRQPTMAQHMDLSAEPGLTDVLAGDCELRGAVQSIAVREPEAVAVGSGAGANGRTSAGSLTVLTGGVEPANPPTVLGSQRMRNVLDSARQHNDMVIVDSPPLLAVADTLPLLAMVDGTILVARLGLINRAWARRVHEVVARVPGAKVLGVVANGVPTTELGTAGYGYGYGYGPPDRS